MGPKPEIPGQQSWSNNELYEDTETLNLHPSTDLPDTPGTETNPEKPELIEKETEAPPSPIELYEQLKKINFKETDIGLLDIIEEDLAEGFNRLRLKNPDRLQEITSVIRGRFGSGERFENDYTLAKIRALGEAFGSIYLEEIPQRISELKQEQAELDLDGYNPRDDSRNIEIVRIVKNLEAEQQKRESIAHYIARYFEELANELQEKTENH